MNARSMLIVRFLALFRRRSLDRDRQRMRDLNNFASVCAEIDRRD